MSWKTVKDNPAFQRQLLAEVVEQEKQYLQSHPNSLIPLFSQELREIGFEFDFYHQIKCFLPKHKKTMSPIILKYYYRAKAAKMENEQLFFMGFLRYRGMDEVVPDLLAEYRSPQSSETVRWVISDSLYAICSSKYAKDYIDIINNPDYGINRQMIVLLVGKLHIENAIPALIKLLEDDFVCLHAIIALGDFKREELRPIFERFSCDNHSGKRNYAKKALKKLGNSMLQ